MRYSRLLYLIMYVAFMCMAFNVTIGMVVCCITYLFLCSGTGILTLFVADVRSINQLADFYAYGSSLNPSVSQNVVFPHSQHYTEYTWNYVIILHFGRNKSRWSLTRKGFSKQKQVNRKIIGLYDKGARRQER